MTTPPIVTFMFGHDDISWGNVPTSPTTTPEPLQNPSKLQLNSLVGVSFPVPDWTVSGLEQKEKN